jgi:hypothetical protein
MRSEVIDTGREEREVAWQRVEKLGGRLGVVRMTLI